MKKILLLSANPKGTSQLRIDEEVRDIRLGLERARNRDSFDIESRWAVRWGDVRRAMLDFEPQIVHFSGHGTAEDGILFEDAAGAVQFVTGDSLHLLFENFPTLECVVLNACYSEKQASAIHQTVPCVVGMNSEVKDRAAIDFAVAFYDGVLAGFDYDKAFKLGRSGILDPAEVDKPALLSRPFVPGGATAGSHAGNMAATLEKSVSLEQIRLASLYGPVDLESSLYVTSPLEEKAFDAIQIPGALVRIRSPKDMGKSSLTLRLMEVAEAQDYRTVTVDFGPVNAKFFDDQDKFTQWFCAKVGRPLGVRVKTEDYWDDIFGANGNCEDFFETYLLQPSDRPIALALENFDRVFDYPDIEVDFCGLLRGWHDRAKRDALWKNLRLVLIYSQESYEPKDINQSPFNVGVPINLGPWNLAQISKLAHLHGLGWRETELAQVMALTGGHPQLVRMTLSAVATGEASLADVLATGATEAGLYSAHLQDRLSFLDRHPELKAAMRQIVNRDEPVRVKAQEAKRLDSMGLVTLQNNEAVPLCDAYRSYLRERLS